MQERPVHPNGERPALVYTFPKRSIIVEAAMIHVLSGFLYSFDVAITAVSFFIWVMDNTIVLFAVFDS